MHRHTLRWISLVAGLISGYVVLAGLYYQFVEGDARTAAALYACAVAIGAAPLAASRGGRASCPGASS